MGPTQVLSAPDGPNVGPMNLAIRVVAAANLWDRQADEYTQAHWSEQHHDAVNGICFIK